MTFAVKADPLIVARARVADLELALAQARPFVKASADRDEMRARQALASIDQRLAGTLHSFTANGARR